MENDVPVERGCQAGNLFSGKMRVLSPDEQAFISGKASENPEAPARRIGTTKSDPSQRLVPDGQGGFRKIGGESDVQPQASEVDAVPVETPATHGNNASEGVIRINDAHLKVTIKCKGKFIMCGSTDYGSEAEFIVCVEAASVDVSDDGVSLLIHGETSIQPPTMRAMTIEIGDKSYAVTYTGGKHRLGRYVNMAFTRI